MIRDWCGVLVIAAALSLAAALLVEVLVLVVGALSGHPDLLKGWVGKQMESLVEWLCGLPVLGALLPEPAKLTAWLPGGGVARDLAVLVAGFFLPLLKPARVLSRWLLAPYPDETLSRATPAELWLRWAGPLGEVQQKAWDGLHHWCQDAGSGAVPFLVPWRTPDVASPFSVAVLTGNNGVGKTHLTEAMCLSLDGSAELAACGGAWARARLRLRRKLRQCLWWRPRADSDPWDYGYLVEDPARRKRLGQFLPRRPTLLVADELQPSSLLEAITDLNARRADFRHPVRLLVIDSAIPAALQLAWQAAEQRWWTALQDLGEVPVFDLSEVVFRTPQLRAMAGAQPSASGEWLQIMGEDGEWTPFVEALDYQPVLLAEAIRLVQKSTSTFEALRRDPVPSETLLESEAGRATPDQAPDIYGTRRAVLRERVLHERAESRERAIRAALADAGESGDELYRALLLVSVAGGCPPERLRRVMGWKTDRLKPAALANVFGRPLAAGWLPPHKPAIVADELLRQYFMASRGVELRDDQRAQIADFVRDAWCVNPAGVQRSAARWRRKRRVDAFTTALLQLPDLAELEAGEGRLATELRAELARAFVELALLHDGDLAAAERALAALSLPELRQLEPALQRLIERDDADGVSAAIVWLRLTGRLWPDVAQLAPERAQAFGIELIRCATGLVRQIQCSPMPESQARLYTALQALLPPFAELATVCAPSEEFRAAVQRLDRAVLAYNASAAPVQVRARIWSGLASGLLGLPVLPGGEAAVWAHALAGLLCAVSLNGRVTIDRGALANLKLVEIPDAARMDTSSALSLVRALVMFVRVLGVRKDSAEVVWRVEQIATSFPAHPDIQHERATVWGFRAQWYKDHDPQATAQAAERVAQVARDFPHHESIQHESAKAWRYLAWAYKDHDSQATGLAAERVAQIARAFPGHEGIQHQSAQAWRFLADAHTDHDPQATEQAAERVAQIAGTFPLHEGIQYESVLAWGLLAWAQHDCDLQATAQAAARVTQIAEAFPRHEGMQYECALVWRYLAWAHRNHDPQATGQAAERVAQIAKVFPRHVGIKLESATSWRFWAWAHHDCDLQATAQAAARVTQIARDHPSHEGIQYQRAQALGYLASAQSGRDPQVIAKAAERLAQVALAFPFHEGIQFESAQAWRNLAWANMYNNPQATAEAVERATQIAQNFPLHEGIQEASAAAWRCLAWAHKDYSPQATADAAVRVAQIAQDFPRHEGIQNECVLAWALFTDAHKDHDPQATGQAAGRVSDIAKRFRDHEGIQLNCAVAWRFLVEAGAKFDDGAAVRRGMAALDAMCGRVQSREQLAWGSSAKVFPCVLEERVKAQSVQQAWEQARGDAGEGQAGR